MNNQITYYQNKLAYEMDSWDLSESLHTNHNIVVIDTRSVEAYANQHIPTAISLPHKTMSEETTNSLDKEKLYICYCDGIGCNASTKGALKMVQLGFQVKELIGGIEWWCRDGHATEGKNGTLEKNIECGC